MHYDVIWQALFVYSANLPIQDKLTIHSGSNSSKYMEYKGQGIVLTMTKMRKNDDHHVCSISGAILMVVSLFIYQG